MTEQVLKGLFDFQKFARSSRLDAIIQNTQSRRFRSLSESELAYVNAAGDPGTMCCIGETEDKDNPWNQY